MTVLHGDLPELPLLASFRNGRPHACHRQRKVRRDRRRRVRTTSRRARRSRQAMKLVDHTVQASGLQDAVAERVAALTAQSARGSPGKA